MLRANNRRIIKINNDGSVFKFWFQFETAQKRASVISPSF